MNYRHEAAATVFELDIANRRDDAAAAALAFLALARIRSAAGAEAEPRDGDRDDGHAVALHRCSEHGGGTEVGADLLGERGKQLVAAPARHGGR